MALGLSGCNLLVDVEVPERAGGAAAVAPLTAAEKFRFWVENLGEVEPGLVYRSAETNLELLGFLAERCRLGHVVVLTRKVEPEEAEFARSIGGEIVHLPMSVKRPPAPQQILELIRVTHCARAEGRSILIHCAAGADRTGVMTAIWRMLFQEAADREALKFESLLHRHLTVFVPMVHRTIDRFRPELYRPFVDDPRRIDDPARVAELEASYFGGQPALSGSRPTAWGPLRAGAARADLLQGWSGEVQLATYGPRPGMAKGVREAVFARALLLDNGQRRIAIVSCDLLIIDAPLRREARRRIEAAGVEIDDLLLAATHTHTGAGGYVDHPVAEFYMLGKFRREMREHLAGRIAAAVEEAARALRPARLGAGRAFVEGLNYNRRLGDTVDTEVGIIRVEDSGGAPLALAVNFAGHPILEPADGTISPDYPGLLARRLDEKYGFGIFLGGALGDLNAGMNGGRGWITEGLAAQVAGRLFEAVERAAPAIRTAEAVELGSLTVAVDLPAVNPGLIPDLLFPLDWLVGALLDWPERAPLQAVRLGDAALIASASEIGARLGRQVKRRSPAPYTFLVTHANGYAGYAVEAVNHSRRKLDPTSMVFLHGSTHGTRVVEAACDLLEAQWGSRLDPAGRLISAAAAEDAAQRGAPRAEAMAREEEEILARADATLPQSRRIGGRPSDSMPEWLRLEAGWLFLEGLRGGDRIEGRKSGFIGRARARGPGDLRLDVSGGYLRSEWRAPGGSDSIEGPTDIEFGLERPFVVWSSPLGGNALRLVPGAGLSAPAGEFDPDAPFALAASSGVWRPEFGGALELTWETYRAIAIESVYRTAAGRRRGRRPGDRWESAVRYSERHGAASLHLELTAALQLPDSRSGGKTAADVEETSFELGLRPGIAAHLGEHVEVFFQGRVPLAHGGSGAGEGRGFLIGLTLAF